MALQELQTTEQCEQLFEFYKEHQDAITMGWDFSDSMVRAEIFKTLLYPDLFFCRLIYKDEILAGVLMGRISATYLSINRQANDTVAYVAPEHRDTSTRMLFGKALKQFESWAKDRGVKHVWFTTYGDYIRRLEKHGYTKTSTLLYKEV